MEAFYFGLSVGLFVLGPFLAAAVVGWLRALARLAAARRELAEAGDYAYRLLEEPEFYRDEVATAVAVADHNVRGVFGRIPNGPPLAVPGDLPWSP